MGVESRYGLKFGYMDHGPRNLITDVPGVRVGHVTLHDGEVHTGVTAIIPTRVMYFTRSAWPEPM